MATLTLTNNVAKGFINKTSGTKFTWWKTSFNMPVKNIFDNNSLVTATEGMLDPIGLGTSFSLAGFEAGWEVVAASSVCAITGPFAGGSVTLLQTWKNALGTTTLSQSKTVVFPSLVAGLFSTYQLASNQGVASWEINADQVFTINITASGAISGSQTNNITFSNVPSVSTYTPGMVWVEGNNLRWSSANGHIHTMVGTLVASPGATPGFVWVEGDYICWIGSGGGKYRGKFNFRQFASIFSNGPSPGVVSGQTPGYAWCDTNFGYEHIGYIATDGYKWINNAGDDPYV